MSKYTAGQKVVLPGFVIVNDYGFTTWSSGEMSEHGYITVAPHDLEFTVPATFNAVAAEVAAIEKKLDTMADEYHGKVANLKERIASLLCIENKPSVAAEDDDFTF